MYHILYLKQDNKTKDVICFITLRVLVYYIYLGKHVIIKINFIYILFKYALNTTEIITAIKAIELAWSKSWFNISWNL